MKALLLCTKASPTLYNVLGKYITTEYMGEDFMQDGIKDPKLNGKIVAECDFEVDKIEYKHIKERDKFGILHNESWYEYKGLNVSHYECDLASRSGFDDEHSLFNYLFEYLIDKEGYPQDGYAIHIKNLHIFNEPKYLIQCSLLKAPQNMCYGFYKEDERVIVIPIKPQEMCRILNGEKTTLVRKKALKEMLK